MFAIGRSIRQDLFRHKNINIRYSKNMDLLLNLFTSLPLENTRA